jgi:N,N'-diacetylbacillosaminyl-diphospho-undecaprenol alpha-1,3-N-acetylgalactosaminyltransferase
MGLYALAFTLADRVQFLNPEDLRFFVSAHMLRRNKAVLIRSSGVSLSEYNSESVDLVYLQRLRADLGIDPGTQVVTMVARAYWSKGVREFVDAAKMTCATQPAKFLLVGAIDNGFDAVPIEYLKRHESNVFQWLNFRHDVRELLALSDIVVLPSYYPEGIPRSLLEAMSMGTPIVTTDAPGCREVVDDGVNGYLVPVRDGQALVEAIDDLLGDAKKRERFGHYSRLKVESEFDERLVVQKTLELLYRL